MTLNKLRAAFSIASFLLIGVLACVSWLTLKRMTELEHRLTEVLEKQWAKVDLSTEAVRYSSRNNRITMQLFLLTRTQEMTPLLAERARNSDTISELLNKIDAHAETGEEKRLLAKIWETRKPYVESYKEALALLLEQGDHEKAKAKMVRVTLPRLVEYHEQWEAFVELQGEQIRQSGLEGKADILTARKWLRGMLGLGVFLVMGLWVSISLVPIKVKAAG